MMLNEQQLKTLNRFFEDVDGDRLCSPLTLPERDLWASIKLELGARKACRVLGVLFSEEGVPLHMGEVPGNAP